MYFPFFADITNKKILIIGGGKVAAGKVERLIPYKPHIVVVAPRVTDEIVKMNVEIHRRSFEVGDIDGAFAVIAATNDASLNDRIYNICTDMKIPVNTVDDKGKCSFIFPALAHCGDISIGISTGGKSPIMSRYVKDMINNSLDKRYAEIVDIVGECRKTVKERFETEESRKSVLTEIVKLCLENETLPSKEEIDLLLERETNAYKNRNKRV